MTTTIEVLFVAAGLFCLVWAITATNAGPGRRIAAGSFGLIALIVALILRPERHDREDW